MPPRGSGLYHWNTNLQRIVDKEMLAVGDAVLAVEVRGQGIAGVTHERESGMLAA